MSKGKFNQIESLSIGDVVTQHPELVGVFMKYKVDFCCGGDRNVIEAIQKDTDELDELIDDAEVAMEAALNFQMEGKSIPLSEFSNEQLIDRILTTHHRYLKETLPKLSELMFKILGVHGEHHPELFDIHKIFGTLKTELEGHLIKEEKQLFPRIIAGGAEVRALIEELEAEHVGAGDALHELTELTDHFTVPSDACTTYGLTYKMLQELVTDMYMHVHTENNVLFKRF